MLACLTGKSMVDSWSQRVARLEGVLFILWQLSHRLKRIQDSKDTSLLVPLPSLVWLLLVLASFSFLKRSLFHTVGKMSPTAPGLPHTSSVTKSLGDGVP